MKLRSLGVAVTGAALIALALAPGASASGHTTPPPTVDMEQYGGAASGQALDLSILGQRVTLGAGLAGSELDTVADLIDATATGIGNVLDEQTMAVAGMGESDERCAAPELADLFGALNLAAGVLCGKAEVTGSGTEFVATGTGSVADLTITGAGVVQQLFDDPTLGPILDEAFGTLQQVTETAEQQADEQVDPAIQAGVDTLNGVLTDLVGTEVLPSLDVSDTLADLLDRITNSAVASITAGDAAGVVTSTAETLTSQARDQGAVVELLPAFWPDGRALATVRVADSVAEAVYHRADASTSGSSSTALVTIESPLLPQTIEVAPSERVELFCDGPLGILCSEISVGSPTEEHLDDGRLRVSSSLVTVHLAKNLDQLLGAGALSAGSLPGLEAVAPAGVLESVTSVAGILGLPVDGLVTTADSDTPSGIRLEVAGAVAEAGGGKALRDPEPEPKPAPTPDDTPFEGPLPRTGLGEAFPIMATALAGVGVGLRSLLRRRGQAA